MKGTSKIIMGATLTMLLSLAIVLGLVLVLLAQLYCSLLLRRRHLRKTTTSAAAAQLATPPQHHPTAPTLSTFYAQGVLHAPRNFLFPAVFPQTTSNNINYNLDLETQNSELPKKPHEVGLMFSSTPPSPAAFVPMASPKLVHGEDGGAAREDCVYICNPIYDLEANMPCGAVDTPFETPDSSPSRLSGGSDNGGQSACCSPAASSVALTPMKELPAKACSVSLKDASSFGTSRSESISNNDGVSSSSSCSPSTSSW